MRKLIEMLQSLEGEKTETMKIATGKYEFTGEIFKSVLKIIHNGREDSI